ncbi:MAG: DUF502 domain-containing protein [Opitutae bacterium]|nr:DUF502 domain-containing protein [Opitutae bacterium]
MSESQNHKNAKPATTHAGKGGEGAKRAFLTGLFVCLPVALTVYVVVFLVRALAAPARGVMNALLSLIGFDISRESAFFDIGSTLAAAVIVAIVIGIIGFISRVFFGKWLLKTVDKFLYRLPMVSSVYSAIRQIFDAFGTRDEQKYSKVVFVEFPRKNCWTLAFLTSDAMTAFDDIAGTKLLHVFVPTTPNPTGGYMILVPATDVKYLDISVADAMKMIISGGALVPDNLQKKSEGKVA